MSGLDGVGVAAIATAVSAIVASIVTFLVARFRYQLAAAKQAAQRASQGSVNGSDAELLWGRMVDELDRRELVIKEMGRQVDELQQEVRRLRTYGEDREDRLTLLSEKVAALMQDISARDARILALEENRRELKARVEELENELRDRLAAAARAVVPPPAPRGMEE